MNAEGRARIVPASEESSRAYQVCVFQRLYTVKRGTEE
jgi:hypothetical protein